MKMLDKNTFCDVLITKKQKTNFFFKNEENNNSNKNNINFTNNNNTFMLKPFTGQEEKNNILSTIQNANPNDFSTEFNFYNVLKERAFKCVSEIINICKESEVQEKKFLQRIKIRAPMEDIYFKLPIKYETSIFPRDSLPYDKESRDFVDYINTFFPQELIGNISMNRAPEISEYMIILCYFIEKQKANGVFLMFCPRNGRFYRNNISKMTAHHYYILKQRQEYPILFSENSQVSIMQYFYNFKGNMKNKPSCLPYYLGKVNHTNWRKSEDMINHFGPQMKSIQNIKPLPDKLKKILLKKKKINSHCVNGQSCYCMNAKNDIMSDIDDADMHIFAEFYKDDLCHFAKQIKNCRHIYT